MNTVDMQQYNANYIGGDILGGIADIGQLVTRPALRRSPYRTSSKGIYICSASTPPGGGVHGMCGFNAAERAINDLFRSYCNNWDGLAFKAHFPEKKYPIGYGVGS